MTVNRQTLENIRIHHIRDISSIHHSIQRQKLKIPDSKKQSIGYETMTTATDVDPEVTDSLQYVKQWTLNHIQADLERVKVTNRFSKSESGVIGISCEESPSLSVMYKDTERLVILSNDKTYRSATFIKINGTEYLAAASDEDGCLYLWNIESRTPRNVFDPKLPRDKLYKYMNICKIDESTIGYEKCMLHLTEVGVCSFLKQIQ